MLKAGDALPDVSLPGKDGTPVRLRDLAAQKTLVVYFYPADETPICTKEACSFRDSYEDFKKAGAEVVGISADSVESHQGFAAKHRLPFVLLSDPEGAATKAFGVKRSFLGLMPGRVTFVVDRSGTIRHSFSAALASEKHMKEALEAIRAI